MTGGAPQVLINHQIFLYRDKAPFVPSGKSVLGALEYDAVEDKLKCHECGGWHRHIGAHAVLKHGIFSSDYKKKHGLRVTCSLIGRRVKKALSQAGKRPANANKLAQSNVRTRLKKGQSARTKTGLDHEKRNIRGSCQAQMKESISRLAAHLGRTPTADEAQTAGINVSSAVKVFRMPWREIILSLGLVPRNAGMRTDRQRAAGSKP